jgi:hypothetical protein
MSGSACHAYVTWYHGLSSEWVTWPPGTTVEPGAVGHFDSEGKFRHRHTLSDFGLSFRTGTRHRPGSVFVHSENGIHLKAKASAESGATFAFLGGADAGIKITAEREHACVLHMRDLSEAWIKDLEPIMVALRDGLLNKQWPVDNVVVVRRMKVKRGFAVISRKAGPAFEVKATGKINFADLADLAGAEFELTGERARNDFLYYEFGPGATPVFSESIRVKRELWDKLLRWRRDRGVLIAPDGRRYKGPPEDLSKYLPKDRLFDPEHSAMSRQELMAIRVQDLFEEVDALPAEADPNLEPSADSPARLLSFPRPVLDKPVSEVLAKAKSFLLPPPAGLAALAAATRGAAPVLLDIASPDGITQFTWYSRGTGRYWLEVTLTRRAAVPAVVTVRYHAVDGAERDLLIPVAGEDDDPSSVVNVRDYAPDTAWSASPAITPADDVWPEEIVVRSVQAAITADTARAWEQLIAIVSDDTGAIINRELRVLQNRP